MPLEKRTWNEANAATNVSSRSYDEILIVWFNLDPRVLSYPSLAPQGQVGEDPCDWVRSGQMGKYLALGQDNIFPSGPPTQSSSTEQCTPVLSIPPSKCHPIQQHIPISLLVGNTHNWPGQRCQLFSCINAGFRRIFVYISPQNIQRVNQLINVLQSSNFAVFDCCYFLCYWLQSQNWNLHKLLELPRPYNVWT